MEEIKLQETYVSINGVLVKADILGDLWTKNEDGVWVPYLSQSKQ